MIRAQADIYIPRFEEKGYPVRIHHAGKRGYVLTVITADGRPGVELDSMHEAEHVLAGLKARTQPKEATSGS